MHTKILIAGIILGIVFIAASAFMLNRKTDTSLPVQYTDAASRISFEYPSSTWHLFKKGNAIMLLKQSVFPDIQSEIYALGDQMIVWIGPLQDYHNKPTTIDAYMANELQENAFTGKPTAHTIETRSGIRADRVEHANPQSPHTLDYSLSARMRAKNPHRRSIISSSIRSSRRGLSATFRISRISRRSSQARNSHRARPVPPLASL